MADIVNKRAPEEGKRRKTASEIRHDLQNHVSVDQLYAYNETIQEIQRLSQGFFGTYITQSVKYWSEKLATVGFFGTSYGLFKGDTEREILHTSITLKENLDVEEPSEVLSSIVEILDPFDTGFKSNADGALTVFNKLRNFIELGLYPLVVQPMSDADFYDAFEKYDNGFEGMQCIGTIVAVEHFTQDESHHIVATVLWNPTFTQDYPTELLISKAGTLTLANLIPTPSYWVDRGEALVTNIGLPLYVYKPMRQIIEEIRFIDSFQDYLNEAVVTGNITLDFVSSLLNHTSETITELTSVLEKSAKEKSPSEKETLSQTSAIPEVQEDVLVENAADDDAFGHRLRLYDDDYFDDVSEDGILGGEPSIL